MARTAEQLDVVTIAPEARHVVREAMSQEPDPDRLALWLEVRGVQHAQFVYDLYFQAAADAAEEDWVVDDGEITVVVPEPSVDRLRGARLEWSSEGEGGLVLVNPNAPEPEELGVPAEVMAAGLDGPLGSRVRAVLDQAVNPSIASHGGRADLVAIDESGGVAYLRLSGGCQGCAMSRMTLTQGIEAALREEVPDLTRVVDVTDHAGGDNPYY
jgi:Fe/S biogenesis protein NfuA